MINISLNDLLLFPELSSYTEDELLPTYMDIITLPFLHKLGLDTMQGYEFVANNFRTLQDTVILGYHVSGEIRRDDEWRKSPLCSTLDRMIITTKEDISLTRELCSLMNCSLNYKSFDIGEEETVIDYEDDCEPTYEAVSGIMLEMREKLLAVRGSSLGADGGMKTYEEYLGFVA